MVNYGDIAFFFQHKVNGERLVVDEMKYTNAAGNRYEVNEIQWFISDITLHLSDGDSVRLDPDKFA